MAQGEAKKSLPADEKRYYISRRKMVEREVKELAAERRFDEIEDTFFLYGRFLERHSEAVKF